MIRRVIQIEEEKCTGCGLCVNACHEGAIGLVNGKAHLMRDDYCDGLGDCLPSCPVNAISFVEREAAAYDEAAVQVHKEKNNSHVGNGSNNHSNSSGGDASSNSAVIVESELRQWPVQIKLAPLSTPYFEGADLLIAADCTAYAYGSFHRDFIRGKVTLIGCPKLDSVDYSEKLTEIFRRNDIRSISIARMQVPCCGGIVRAVETAIAASGKEIPCTVTIIATTGELV